MGNRATNQGMMDANSQLPLSAIDSPLITTTSVPVLINAGQGVLHGFLVVAGGTGGWGATIYDAAAITGTLNSTTAVGVLTTTTTGGVLGYQWAGDVIYNNGLVIQNQTGSSAGAIKVLYL